ncbi:hypothetical protein HG535_0F00740 [Zygotorulaspora mrakii]|uniref:Cytochrome c oxidase assembly factor 6 n=1 Tax=Zygotorulaspora mrakii TaxID=42260 RepID=A0A7H9B5C5_ZYGMR|nr:uncharacterized protein HG535_0F00740 [Zygotorulaspora mrakii]QLG73564.1 hypothetical protein HG535_0F00740 [Zygotorulaspora mrakii]
MGWFTKDAAAHEYQPNNRSARKLCWEARDDYFACLNSIHVVNALEPQHQQQIEKACSNQDRNFNENCAASWIKYFKEKRVVDHRKEQFMKDVERENAQIIELTPDQMVRK